MNLKTMNKFMKIMSNANRAPEKGVSLEAHAEITFKEFNKEMRKFMSGKGESVDHEVLAMVGASLEMQYKGARNSVIKIGILKLMIDMVPICFAKEKDKELLAKVAEKKVVWQKELDETEARVEKAKTLTMADIMNAPIAAGIPNN